MVIASEAQGIIDKLAERNTALERENKILREQLALIRQHMFGRRTERIEAGQLGLFSIEGLGAQAAEAAATLEKAPKRHRKPKGHGRAPFPAHLLRERVECSVPEEERSCPDCGKEMRKIGTEVTERGHFVPAHFVVRSFEREKLACPAGHAVVTAKAPEPLVRRCKYEPSAYAHVAVSKYQDHRVPRRHAQQPQGRRSESCCMEDEGWPLGIGVQAQVPNHLELLGSRVRVVSVEGNGAARPRQVRSKKTSASEPLMTCREVSIRRRNRAGWLARDEPRGSLLTDWVASGMKAA